MWQIAMSAPPMTGAMAARRGPKSSAPPPAAAALRTTGACGSRSPENAIVIGGGGGAVVVVEEVVDDDVLDGRLVDAEGVSARGRRLHRLRVVLAGGPDEDHDDQQDHAPAADPGP